MSFRRYASYKDSGVEWLGEVPEHWEVKRLKYLLKSNGLVRGPFGGDLKKEIFIDSGIKVYEQRNAIYKDYLLGDSYISELKFKDMSRFLVSPGDFIMSCSGTIGRTFRIPEDAPVGIINQALLIIRFSKSVNNNYAEWIFSADFFQRQILDNSQGGAMKNLVGMDVFTSIGLPVPSLDEQFTIAVFLDREIAKIDALIAEQQQLIELLKEKRQAVISHAVTKGLNPPSPSGRGAGGEGVPMKDSGIEWLGEVPAHWKVSAIKRQCSLLKDGTHLPPARVDDGVPLLSVRNIRDGEFGLRDDDSMISEVSYQELCKAFIPNPKDVLLAIVGATLGKTALVPNGLGDFHIQRSVAIFRPSIGMKSKWLNFVFQSQKFQQLLWEYVGYSAQPGIYLGTLAEFRIPLPPLPEQDSIITFLDNETTKLDALTTEAQRAIDLLKERRTALISAAVTGKIDVRTFAT